VPEVPVQGRVPRKPRKGSSSLEIRVEKIKKKKGHIFNQGDDFVTRDLARESLTLGLLRGTRGRSVLGS